MSASDIALTQHREHARLLRLWGDAERLHTAILHQVNWTSADYQRRDRMLKIVERTRLRSNRRYQAMRDFERRN